MKADDKKRAIAAYKEREEVAGIYAVRCLASGEIWVGQTLTLDSVWNRIAFTLRLGNHPRRTLQAAWREHGAGRLAFEVLERLPEEESAFVRDALLKERTAHWRARLGAQAL